MHIYIDDYGYEYLLWANHVIHVEESGTDVDVLFKKPWRRLDIE